MEKCYRKPSFRCSIVLPIADLLLASVHLWCVFEEAMILKSSFSRTQNYAEGFPIGATASLRKAEARPFI
jgi:hypothetical protein